MDEFKNWLAECIQTLPSNLSHVKADIKQHFDYMLEQAIRERKLLLRDEFDVQCKVLSNIEARLSKIEKEL